MYQKKSDAIKMKMIKPYKKTNYVRIIILSNFFNINNTDNQVVHICMGIRQ